MCTAWPCAVSIYMNLNRNLMYKQLKPSSRILRIIVHSVWYALPETQRHHYYQQTIHFLLDLIRSLTSANSYHSAGNYTHFFCFPDPLIHLISSLLHLTDRLGCDAHCTRHTDTHLQCKRRKYEAICV